jgi:hypothetical protein
MADGISMHIHLHAAELFRNHDGRQPELRRFAQNRNRYSGLLVLNVVEVRLDFLAPEFIGGARDCAVLLREVFRCENFLGRAVLNEKCATQRFWKRDGCRRHI